MIRRYKVFGWLLLGAILVLAQGVRADAIFSSLQWNNRVLVLHADEGDADLEEQVFQLSGLADALEERELIVLQLRSRVLEKVPDLSPFPFDTKVLDNRQERRYLESLFQADDNILRVTLIGLDGEIKRTWDSVANPAEIFDVIDAVPMRQDLPFAK